VQDYSSSRGRTSSGEHRTDYSKTSRSRTTSQELSATRSYTSSGSAFAAATRSPTATIMRDTTSAGAQMTPGYTPQQPQRKQQPQHGK